MSTRLTQAKTDKPRHLTHTAFQSVNTLINFKIKQRLDQNKSSILSDRIIFLTSSKNIDLNNATDPVSSWVPHHISIKKTLCIWETSIERVMRLKSCEKLDGESMFYPPTTYKNALGTFSIPLGTFSIPPRRISNYETRSCLAASDIFAGTARPSLWQFKNVNRGTLCRSKLLIDIFWGSIIAKESVGCMCYVNNTDMQHASQTDRGRSSSFSTLSSFN